MGTAKSILLVTDLEGIIGFSKKMTENESKIFMCKHIMCVISSIRSTNPKKCFTVCNVHNNGKLISDVDFSNDSSIHVLQGIDELKKTDWNFDYAMLLGFHGMRNSGGRYDHTFRSDFIRVRQAGKNVDLGEIGLFILWIESKGIPVVLVNGEGEFESELSNRNCIIHKTNGILENRCQYNTLMTAVQNAIQLPRTVSMLSLPCSATPILVQVDNPDKLLLLASEGFRVKNGAFVFYNLDDFFERLTCFAISLNNAIDIIVKKNIEISRKIRKIQNFYELIEPYYYILLKPIELIDQNDRDILTKGLKL